jgi:hypothetical protein
MYKYKGIFENIRGAHIKGVAPEGHLVGAGAARQARHPHPAHDRHNLPRVQVRVARGVWGVGCGV